MRAPLTFAVLAGLLTLATAGPAGGEWYETRITATPDPSTNPFVTVDAFDGMHIFWEEAGEIRHLLQTLEGWGDVEVVGTGIGFATYTCLM